jgi:hypothetical protein
LKNERIGIIIGSDVPEPHWVLDQRRGGRKEPYAVKTLLGWTLLRPVGSELRREFQVKLIQNQENVLQKQVERMIQMDFSENNDYLGKGMSLEDQRALSILEGSVKKVGGHYEIALPWRSGKAVLPNNRKMAERRLAYLQTRLRKDSSVQEKYLNVIDDYLEKGYAARVREVKQISGSGIEDMSGWIWYLPRHPVFHPQKPNKVCVIFDCAAKFESTSLNDQLLQGPDLNNSLFGVLRFCQDPIVLTSDVEAMFHPSHRILVL